MSNDANVLSLPVVLSVDSPELFSKIRLSVFNFWSDKNIKRFSPYWLLIKVSVKKYIRIKENKEAHAIFWRFTCQNLGKVNFLDFKLKFFFRSISNCILN